MLICHYESSEKTTDWHSAQQFSRCMFSPPKTSNKALVTKSRYSFLYTYCGFGRTVRYTHPVSGATHLNEQ